MKFNEPVRPAGIGRKQVAFDLQQNPSAITIIEDNENSASNVESTEGKLQATLSETMKLARVAAYSAASSALIQGQNEIWGVQGVEQFTVNPTTGGYVKWQKKGTIYNYNWAQINNQYMYIDSEDSSKIWVNKAGWWLVDALVEVTNYKNAVNYRLDIITGGGDDIVIGFDSVHTNQYPTLRVNALVPVPAVNSLAEWPPYFQIRYRIDGLNSSQNLQGNGFIHAVWMKPFEYNESHGNA